jgi:hypothetical protein
VTIVLNLSNKIYKLPFKKSASDVDISLTKNSINKLCTVSRIFLEAEQSLSETFLFDAK